MRASIVDERLEAFNADRLPAVLAWQAKHRRRIRMGIGFLGCIVIGMVLMVINAHWPPGGESLRRILWLMMGAAGIGAVLFLRAMG